MDASPLSTLSAELRLQVYEALFDHGSPVTLYFVAFESSPFLSHSSAGRQDALALLSVCHQVRREALPVYYVRTVFSFYIDCLDGGPLGDMLHRFRRSKQDLRTWLRNNPIHASSMRHVSLDVGDWLTSYNCVDLNHNDWTAANLPGCCQELRDLFRQNELEVTVTMTFHLSPPCINDDSFTRFALLLPLHCKQQAHSNVADKLQNTKAAIEAAPDHPDVPDLRDAVRRDQRVDLKICEELIEQFLVGFDATDYR